MGRNRFYKRSISNVIKIFRVLKQAEKENEGMLTVSEIARRTKLHKWTVSRTIDLFMSHFVEIFSPDELEYIGMRVKLVRLVEPKLKEEQIIRYLRYSRGI